MDAIEFDKTPAIDVVRGLEMTVPASLHTKPPWKAMYGRMFPYIVEYRAKEGGMAREEMKEICFPYCIPPIHVLKLTMRLLPNYD